MKINECMNYKPALEKKEQGDKLEIRAYQIMGCYECNGRDMTCVAYLYLGLEKRLEQ